MGDRITVNREDKLPGRTRLNSGSRHHDGISKHVGDEFHIDELIREKPVIRIREIGLQFHRTGRGIDGISYRFYSALSDQR